MKLLATVDPLGAEAAPNSELLRDYVKMFQRGGLWFFQITPNPKVIQTVGPARFMATVYGVYGRLLVLVVLRPQMRSLLLALLGNPEPKIGHKRKSDGGGRRAIICFFGAF